MSDALREILRSPLDDHPARGGRNSRPLIGTVAVALAAGALAGLVVPASGKPTPPSTTTTTGVAVVSRFPPGYTDVGREFGLRADWIYRRGEETFVGVSSAYRNDSAPTGEALGSTRLGGSRRSLGLWTMVLADGRRLTDAAELFDDAAPGMVTLQFDSGPIDVADVVAVELTPAAQSGARVATSHLDIAALPVDIVDLPETVLVTELVTQSGDTVTRSATSVLVVDRITARKEAGFIEWHLEGDPTVRAFVEVTVDLLGSDGVLRGQLFSATGRSAQFLQREVPPVGPLAVGTTQLERARGVTLDAGEVESATVTWSLGWERYDAATTYSLDITALSGMDDIPG
ncbi:MAG: hypothetical protein A2Z12_03060 [Actinobacteria bacterium RBG_16_68_21]|nr:MAG: hypothetical protein A2Z12_03060 [Actinobacteria bacterium RBG_16_68_21]